MDTPKAGHKFNEARHFFLLLQEEQQGEPAFGRCLSAFLNAEYSVVEVLEFEAKTVLKAGTDNKGKAKARFDTWFAQWLAGLTKDERALWEAMRTQRGHEVHQLGVETTKETKIIPVDPSRLPLGMIASREAQVHYFEIAGKRLEVVDACYQYESLLHRLLKDFHRSPPR